jgi:hypothetical protein
MSFSRIFQTKELFLAEQGRLVSTVESLTTELNQFENEFKKQRSKVNSSKMGKIFSK